MALTDPIKKQIDKILKDFVYDTPNLPAATASNIDDVLARVRSAINPLEIPTIDENLIVAYAGGCLKRSITVAISIRDSKATDFKVYLVTVNAVNWEEKEVITPDLTDPDAE